jgi:hypothetical protein
MRRDDDDDDDGKRPVLGDGQRVRVPMIFRDSAVQRAIRRQNRVSGRAQLLRDAFETDARTVVTDAFGNTGLALQRPGARYLSIPEHTVDSALAVADDYNRAQAYALADAEARYSWKGGPQEGDECTIDGRPGRLEKRGDEFVCVPSGERDAASVQDELERAYVEVALADSERWKQGRR